MLAGSRLSTCMQHFRAGAQQATFYSGGTQADSDRYRQAAGRRQAASRQQAGSKQAASRQQAGSKQAASRHQVGSMQAVGKQTA
jgi:hypothetical protein